MGTPRPDSPLGGHPKNGPCECHPTPDPTRVSHTAAPIARSAGTGVSKVSPRRWCAVRFLPLPAVPTKVAPGVRSFPARGEEPPLRTRCRHSSLRTSEPTHPFGRRQSRPAASRGWTPDRGGSLSQQPGWASGVRGPFPSRTPDSWEPHPKPRGAPPHRQGVGPGRPS